MAFMITLRNLAVVILLLAVTVAAAQQSAAYRLATGDKVAISVFGEDELSMNVTLSDEGILKYPFLGEIRVAGRLVGTASTSSRRALGSTTAQGPRRLG